MWLCFSFFIRVSTLVHYFYYTRIEPLKLEYAKASAVIFCLGKIMACKFVTKRENTINLPSPDEYFIRASSSTRLQRIHTKRDKFKSCRYYYTYTTYHSFSRYVPHRAAGKSITVKMINSLASAYSIYPFGNSIPNAHSLPHTHTHYTHGKIWSQKEKLYLRSQQREKSLSLLPVHPTGARRRIYASAIGLFYLGVARVVVRKKTSESM